MGYIGTQPTSPLLDGSVTAPKMAQDVGVSILLAEATASASATIDFDSISSSYSALQFRLQNIIPATDDDELVMQFDYGSGYISTNYTCLFWGQDHGGGSESTNLVTAIRTIGGTASNWGIGNASNEYGSCYIDIPNPQVSGHQHASVAGIVLQNDAQAKGGFSFGIQHTVGTISGVRFFFTADDITSGEFKLYGIQ